MKHLPFLATASLVALLLGMLHVPARAADVALVPVSLHLAHGVVPNGEPACGDAPSVERISTRADRSRAVSAFAAALGYCEGRLSVVEAGPLDTDLTFLPTRVQADGGWISEIDAARLVRAMSPSRRDGDFLPAESLGTRGPDLVVEAALQSGEPEGFLLTTGDATSARWFRSSTAWVADPDRIGVAGGGSVLATCSTLSETCLVTVPVCADAAVGYEARGVRDPSALGPAILRAARDAGTALGCGSRG
jgi:hypothetical protein